MALLVKYDWPGNVRQLENTLFRAVVLADGDELTILEFPQIAAHVDGFEVRVPPGFDNRTSRAGTSEWTARGVTRPDGTPPPDVGPMVLFYPAGGAGPAFLVTENFEVIKTYNFSDAYVLSVAQLADRMEGRDPVQARWPSDPPMGREARVALQARLVALGYPVDNRQGRVSLALRDTVRRAQASVGLAVDGNPTDALLQALATALPAAP